MQLQLTKLKEFHLEDQQLLLQFYIDVLTNAHDALLNSDSKNADFLFQAIDYLSDRGPDGLFDTLKVIDNPSVWAAHVRSLAEKLPGLRALLAEAKTEEEYTHLDGFIEMIEGYVEEVEYEAHLNRAIEVTDILLAGKRERC
jgi:hypothetical protein